MASIEPLSQVIHGKSIQIRCARRADAPLVMALNREMAGFEFSVAEADESNADIAELAAGFETAAADPQLLRLIALHEGHVVGSLDFIAPSKRRIRHRGRFGIAVSEQWRGKGIGTALIRVMIDWAKAHPHIEKIRLGVLAANVRAKALYERMGFVEEARRKGEFKLPGGRYVDDVMMCLWVKRGAGGM